MLHIYIYIYIYIYDISSLRVNFVIRWLKVFVVWPSVQRNEYGFFLLVIERHNMVMNLILCLINIGVIVLSVWII